MKVYLDYNSTTPLHEEVAESIAHSLAMYENPSGLYERATYNRQKIDIARQQLAALLNADPEELVFTSGGTESNNTVLSLCHLLDISNANEKKKEVIVSAIEHHSVLNCAQNLEKYGIKVHYIPVDRSGRIELEAYKTMLSDTTAIVSIMLANNELGTIQDIKSLAALAHQSGALFHTDAVQAVAKMTVDVKDLDVDFLSVSGHKFYGPKGIGALYVKNGSLFTPLNLGGKQEAGRRGGTENIPGIIGLGKAAEVVMRDGEKWNTKLKMLKAKLNEGLFSSIDHIQINGNPEHCLSQTVNMSIEGVDAETLLVCLDAKGISVSSGAACNSGSLSHVLQAIGVEKNLLQSTLRISLGYHNTEEDIDYTVRQMGDIVHAIRKL